MTEFEELKRLIIIMGKDVLSTKEVALYMDVTPEHVRYLTSQGKIPHYHPKDTKGNYYRKSEIDAYLTGVRVDSQSEIKAEAKRVMRELRR